MHRRTFLSMVVGTPAVAQFSQPTLGQSGATEPIWATEGATARQTGYNPSVPRIDTPLEVEWSFPAPAARVGYRPVGVSVGSDHVYAASRDQNLYKIDQDTGTEVWRSDLGGAPAGPPTIRDNTIFATTAAGNVFAVDAETGDQNWIISVEEGITGSPIVSGDSLYVTDEYGADCYMGACDEWLVTLTSIDISDGTKEWTVETEDNRQSMSPTAGDGIVIATGSRRVVAYDADSGEEMWRVDSGAGPSAETALGDKAFIPAESRMIAVENPTSATANEIAWRFNVSGEINGAPVLSEDAVFFKTKRGNLYRVDRESGQKDWMRPLSGLSYSELTGVANTIYAGEDDGNTLYAVDMDSGEVVFEADIGSPEVIVPGQGRIFQQSDELYSFAPRSPTPTETDSSSSNVADQTNASGPGFGVGSAAVAVGLGAYYKLSERF